MRLVTWNCSRGAFALKVPFLNSLMPDVAVVQECGRPIVENDQRVWFGDNPRQGLAVQAAGAYRLRPLPTIAEVPPHAVPVEVTGPRSFTLLAVWSKRHAQYPYVEGVVRAVELYHDLLTAGPSVVIGDFNSNAIWDSEHPPDRNHTALVTALGESGLCSSYHAFHGETHGAETRPTYYFHWNEEKPFHIDYCFVPHAWIPQLGSVEIGSYAAWHGRSDHRPLIVDLVDKPTAATVGR